MTASPTLRILYVGHDPGTGERLREAFESRMQQKRFRRRHPDLALRFVMESNQKQAQVGLRRSPPHGILVQISPRYPRVRFCRYVRNRAPKSPLVAVSDTAQPPQACEFDAVLPRSLPRREVARVMDRFVQVLSETQVRVGPFCLDTLSREVLGPHGRAELPPKQCALLRMLMEQAGHVVQRAKLMATIWETDFLEDTRTLDVHVRWLREKIEPEPSNPVYIRTVRGEGYIFMPTPPSGWEEREPG